MKDRATFGASLRTSSASSGTGVVRRVVRSVVRRLALLLLLLLAAGTMAQDVATPSSFSISGSVRSGSTPIPGATVTATNSSTGEKISTSSGIDGTYTLQV